MMQRTHTWRGCQESVTLDGPSLIRVLEYARETLSGLEGEEGDVALHFLADELLSRGEIKMENYVRAVQEAEARTRTALEERTPHPGTPGRDAEEANVGALRSSSVRCGATTKLRKLPRRIKNLSDLPPDYRVTLQAYGVDLLEAEPTLDFGAWAESMRGAFTALGPNLESLLPKLYASSRGFLEKYRGELERVRTGLTPLTGLLNLYHAGKAGRGWYRNSERMLRHLFPDPKDRDLAATILASTSARVSVKENVSRFLDAYEDMLLQREFRDRFHSKILRNIEDQWAWAPDGPKVRNFKRALLGDPDACVIDAWMLSALGMGGADGGLTLATYTIAEKRLREVAKALNMPPADVTPQDVQKSMAQIQERIWVGLRGHPQGTSPATELSRNLGEQIQNRYEQVKGDPHLERIWRPLYERMQKAPRTLLSSTPRRGRSYAGWSRM